MKNQLLLLVILAFQYSANAQHSHEGHSRAIIFPDIPGYKTLKCDFHIHTVFSDGNVWPTIRVEEAVKDGLDAISMTDHIEYQPHGDDIPHPDRNRSNEIAKAFAAAFDLIVVSGIEITRDMPPGHCNAIFIEDANKFVVEQEREEDAFNSNPEEILMLFREAKRQGAFVFWNHPNWVSQRPDGFARMDDLHRQLLEEDLLHGIEVVNDVTYSDEALELALENDLTVMGTSDIHGLVDWQYNIPEGGHRPISLIFATEKSEAAIKDALLAGRSVAYYNNYLIGKQEFLKPLITSSIEVTKAAYQDKTTVLTIEIDNNSDVDYILQNTSNFRFHAHTDLVTLKAQNTTMLAVKTGEQIDGFPLSFMVLNAVSAPKVHPEIIIDVEVRK